MQLIRYIKVNRHEREATKIKTNKKGFQTKSCPVCGRVLSNPSWKLCERCHEFIKDQRNLENKKENKH